MTILYLDATVRTKSRTAELARELLAQLGGATETVRLIDLPLPPVDEAYLAARDSACAAQDFSGEMFAAARQFAAADIIVIAAPYWDLSFPARLKQYLEQNCVIGLTFAYGSDGRPYGMCRAKQLYYLSTSGGQMVSEEFGFGYVKTLCQHFFGIAECVQFKAEGLDLYGADPQAILAEAKAQIRAYFRENPQPAE